MLMPDLTSLAPPMRTAHENKLSMQYKETGNRIQYSMAAALGSLWLKQKILVKKN